MFLRFFVAGKCIDIWIRETIGIFRQIFWQVKVFGRGIIVLDLTICMVTIFSFWGGFPCQYQFQPCRRIPIYPVFMHEIYFIFEDWSQSILWWGFHFAFSKASSLPFLPWKQIGLTNMIFCCLICRAEYDPKNDLLDDEFMLKGKWYRRKDLEVRISIYLCKARSIYTYLSNAFSLMDLWLREKIVENKSI